MSRISSFRMGWERCDSTVFTPMPNRTTIALAALLSEQIYASKGHCRIRQPRCLWPHRLNRPCRIVAWQQLQILISPS